MVDSCQTIDYCSIVKSKPAPIATNRIKHCPTIGPFQSLLRRSTNAFAVFFNSG